MEMRKIARLLLIVASLSLISESNSQYWLAPSIPFQPVPALRPLCLTQFSLVNYACSSIRYTPALLPPPPPPPLPPPPPASSDAEGPCSPTDGHRRRRHHRHRHTRSPDPQVDECCRWLKELDAQCVCDMFVRLPVFLARPIHAYTVNVNSNCSVSYRCPGRVIMS
ncbi:uncharacterized protein LOC141590170 [Silene latifolia]|uniref:uncharacterized protein LOC141590170 n=1 Tax=Silene latifolia TaxID=37657 RepID=UPI003D76BAC3